MSGVEHLPAFPVPEILLPDGTGIREGYDGMTLREYYAGQALVGLLAGQFRDSGSHNFDGLPREAFNVADAMLAERSRA